MNTYQFIYLCVFDFHSCQVIASNISEAIETFYKSHTCYCDIISITKILSDH